MYLHDPSVEVNESELRFQATFDLAAVGIVHTSLDGRYRSRVTYYQGHFQETLARYRGLESMLPDPSLASPDPARSPNVPRNQAEFLAAYQGREREMVDFLAAEKKLSRRWFYYVPATGEPTVPGQKPALMHSCE